MESKIAKGKNIVQGNFVKKIVVDMKVFSQNAIVLKTDSKLTVTEKANKDSLEKKFKVKVETKNKL